MKFAYVLIFCVLSFNACLAEGGFDARSKGVPMLDELAGDWQNAADLASLPALNSPLGSAQAGRDAISLESVSFPPITMAGQTCSLLVDGQAPQLNKTRWYPYQVLRTATAKNLGLLTSVRLPCENRGALFQLVLTNQGEVTLSFELKLALTANSSRHSQWGWFIPRDSNPGLKGSTGTDGRLILIKDDSEQLANAFAFSEPPDELTNQGSGGTATWQVRLSPHASRTVEFALAVGESSPEVQTLAEDWATHFDADFALVKTDWQTRFDAMFTPHNQVFSGNLPILTTSDSKMRRMYYMSLISVLSVYRTVFAAAPRVYVSNSPEYNCIMMYFWDTSEWATPLAELDPLMLKKYLRDWLSKGIYNGYAEEYLNGTLQGPWYSANDLSVFRLLLAYLDVTRDQAFLKEEIRGKTVLEWMDSIATHWQQLVRPGRTLADYGEAQNLLECVPTYVNEVPSFNAANVWMMRRVAQIQQSQGNVARARELRDNADHLLTAVLALYEPGQGVWDSLHRDGQRVEMRHVFDFATIGLVLRDDLTPATRDAMTGFVERELITDHWMRAQSLSDPAASASDRPDHGPMGAFCAWPAETIEVLASFGEFSRALIFLDRCANVTYEGPFSQSRELLGRSKDAPVRIASRGLQDYNGSNGGAFAEAIICDFFGYQPDFLNPQLVPDKRARGFEGELSGIRNGAGLIDIQSTPQGLRVKHEKNADEIDINADGGNSGMCAADRPLSVSN